jgi:tetratricopeptide (TPR) repeat protein
VHGDISEESNKMSSEEEAVAADEVCASCGIAAVDDVKLMKCACNLLKYCSVACQKTHRPQHKKICRKRLTELRDRDLFEQPDISHLGECPICCLPLPLDRRKSGFMACCSKYICRGCNFANQMREMEAGLQKRCAFCREPVSKSQEEANKRCMKRVKINCPAAMVHMGKKRYNEGDYETSLEYMIKAAKLGDAEAHYGLSLMYREGCGVDKDSEKEVYHSEEAAIAGHPSARYNFGVKERNSGNFERARKHFIIGANLGDNDSLKGLMTLYKDGHASKEDYAYALRAYQAAVDETKSAQREEAEEAIKNGLW